MRNAPVQQSAINTATLDFPPIYTGQIFSISLQLSQADTSAAGTVKIQYSNDFSPAGTLGPFTPTNWTDISGATATITGGALASIPKTDICYQYIRAVWTETTPGSSTMNASWSIQGI